MTDAERAFKDGVRDGKLPYSTNNIWYMSKHFESYCAGFDVGRKSILLRIK